MNKKPYAEVVAAYIAELPTTTNRELLVKVADIVFSRGTAEPPASLPTLYEELKKLLAEFHPDEHLLYDRDALTTSLGEYLVDWWCEVLGRPLTSRDLGELYDDLAESGVREALQRLAAERSTRKVEN